MSLSRSPLSSLPFDIRAAIYKTILHDTIMVLERKPNGKAGVHFVSTCTNIMLTCKAIHYEIRILGDADVRKLIWLSSAAVFKPARHVPCRFREQLTQLTVTRDVVKRNPDLPDLLHKFPNLKTNIIACFPTYTGQNANALRSHLGPLLLDEELENNYSIPQLPKGGDLYIFAHVTIWTNNGESKKWRFIKDRGHKGPRVMFIVFTYRLNITEKEFEVFVSPENV